jgi:hypothetical protein
VQLPFLRLQLSYMLVVNAWLRVVAGTAAVKGGKGSKERPASAPAGTKKGTTAAGKCPPGSCSWTVCYNTRTLARLLSL